MDWQRWTNCLASPQSPNITPLDFFLRGVYHRCCLQHQGGKPAGSSFSDHSCMHTCLAEHGKNSVTALMSCAWQRELTLKCIDTVHKTLWVSVSHQPKGIVVSFVVLNILTTKVVQDFLEHPVLLHERYIRIFSIHKVMLADGIPGWTAIRGTVHFVMQHTACAVPVQ